MAQVLYSINNILDVEVSNVASLHYQLNQQNMFQDIPVVFAGLTLAYCIVLSVISPYCSPLQKNPPLLQK